MKDTIVTRIQLNTLMKTEELRNAQQFGKVIMHNKSSRGSTSPERSLHQALQRSTDHNCDCNAFLYPPLWL